MNIKTRTLSLLIAGMLAAGTTHAQDERASLETLRQTTLNLIQALVESGVLPRDKANALIEKAEQDAARKVAEKVPGTTVRVPYVPEIVKAEMREQIKQEVLAQARTERWAEPNAIPGWLDSIKWEGDLRLSYRIDKFDQTNATATDYAAAAGTNVFPLRVNVNGLTRAADFAKVNSQAEPIGNTADKRERFRLRARLGLQAKISDAWSGGVRLSTGSTTDRVSTNQTLGQDFNKYSLLVDRAFIKYDPSEWFSVTGGRIPNPWFSTDLVWDEDLNFEGIAATLKPSFANNTFKPFLTVGAFPIKEENPPASKGRWMYGIQEGTQWDFSPKTRFKVGLAAYGFKKFEGQVESNSSLWDPVGTGLVPFAANYGQYEYSSNLRQKGNSLFVTNAGLDVGATSYYGLASRFRPVNLTASIDLAHFDPVHVILTSDRVMNKAFDRDEILARTQGRVKLTDGSNTGYQYKLTVGMPQLKEARDWQVSVAYRYLGSDAVVDAFTDSDFGGGGTNLKGHVLGLQYGLDRNATLGLRWFSADSIDSFSLNPAHRFSQDIFQADVNVRF